MGYYINSGNYKGYHWQQQDGYYFLFDNGEHIRLCNDLKEIHKQVNHKLKYGKWL
jgi:hypothetical protein